MRAYNIKDTYIDEDDLWLRILAVTVLVILSTENILKGYSMGQLVFGRDMVLTIKYTVDWELIRQKNQTQINKDNITENSKRVYHEYKVGDEFMLNNNASIRDETA